MGLVPIGGPADGSAPQDWVNPAHIALLTPLLTRVPPGGLLLEARVKIAGVPELTVRLGEFADQAAADARWGQFLATIEDARNR